MQILSNSLPSVYKGKGNAYVTARKNIHKEKRL